jgi:multidrug efflux pump subunit AcrB
MELSQRFVREANKLPQVSSVNSTLAPDIPMLNLVVDKELVKTFNVNLSSLNKTLKQLTGSSVASDFTMFGRTYKVKIQAEAEFRRRPSDLARFYVKADNGVQIPLSILAKVEYGSGVGSVTRHNLFTSASISGIPAVGYSSGQAMTAIEKLANEMLPRGFGYEWTGMSYQEKKASSQTGVAMLLAIVFVYLFLAALYESWIIPIPVLVIVPISLTGAMVFVWLANIDNNLFVQISLVALIGLAAKNSILIVEFAKSLVDKGMPIKEAALESAKQRFRPILMTSISFILGILPLVISSGPGSEARNSISTGTLGGMLFATSIGIILVPLFFVLLVSWADKFKGKTVVEEEVKS